MDAIRYIRDKDFREKVLAWVCRFCAFGSDLLKTIITTEEQLHDTDGVRKRAWKAAATGRYKWETTGRTNEDRLRAFDLTGKPPLQYLAR